MRTLLAILLLLTAALAVLCASAYFTTAARQAETQSELSHSKLSGQPVTDADIAVQTAHIAHQGRLWGFAALLAGSAAFVAIVSVLLVLLLQARAPAAPLGAGGALPGNAGCNAGQQR